MTPEAQTYTHQVFDHQEVLRPIVKASFKASTGAISPMMDKAIAIALEEQPGPVHIDVPITVAENESVEQYTYRLSSKPTEQLTVATWKLIGRCANKIIGSKETRRHSRIRCC